jgi:hypothetical protein
MWKICFEDNNRNVVDYLEFNHYRKAREYFDSLVLVQFQKAVLCRADGTFLDSKEKSS